MNHVQILKTCTNRMKNEERCRNRLQSQFGGDLASFSLLPSSFLFFFLNSNTYTFILSLQIFFNTYLLSDCVCFSFLSFHLNILYLFSFSYTFFIYHFLSLSLSSIYPIHPQMCIGHLLMISLIPSLDIIHISNYLNSANFFHWCLSYLFIYFVCHIINYMYIFSILMYTNMRVFMLYFFYLYMTL